MPLPSIHERLAAAAHRILTDGHRHSDSALVWAMDFRDSDLIEAEARRVLRATGRRPFRFERRELSLGAQQAW